MNKTMMKIQNINIEFSSMTGFLKNSQTEVKLKMKI